MDSNEGICLQLGRGLKTPSLYLLGSGHEQNIMISNFHNHRSPGGDPHLDQISRNCQMGQHRLLETAFQPSTILTRGAMDMHLNGPMSENE